jgi:hypothetical protein
MCEQYDENRTRDATVVATCLLIILWFLIKLTFYMVLVGCKMIVVCCLDDHILLNAP